MKIIKNTINIFKTLHDKSWSYYGKSYSQEGEDLILTNYLGNKKNGFYVDIGAHHPFKFSNTYLFYLNRWKGINIDGTPGCMTLFNKYRSRDINIEAVVSNIKKNINYIIYDEPALNCIYAKKRIKRNNSMGYKIKKKVSLKTKKLSEILNKYMPINTKIDFMNIDIEGYEYAVLLSNDWKKYKPTYILVEVVNYDLDKLTRNKVYQFLLKKGYSAIAITGRTVIFKYNNNENIDN